MTFALLLALLGNRAPLNSVPFCTMDCRVGCGACCIALSISSPIPGMPEGKPSGVRCAQLTAENRCMLWGKPERPEVCNRLTPMAEMCGETTDDALRYLYWLETQTTPRQ